MGVCEAKLGEIAERNKKLVAELQECEKELRASEARFRNLVEKNADSIIVMDEKGIVLFANPATEALFGLTARDFLGEAFGFPVVAGETTELGIIGRAGKSTTGEMRVVEIEWEGKSAFLAVIRDFTDRKRAEELMAQAQAERIEQMERELRSLDQLSRPPTTAVTAQLFGTAPLSASLPDTFDELVVRYGELLDQALEQRAYKVDHDISGSLRSVAEQMGFLKARPRDVVKLHSTVLQRKTSDVPSAKARAYLEEGRIMVLELMGYLSSYYRTHAFSAMRVHSSKEGKKGG